MNTTSLHIKIEEDIKRQAQKTAEDLGLTLSAVTKALLKQFVRTKRLDVGELERPEIPNARTRRILKQAEEDMKAGRGISFANAKEVHAYIDSLILTILETTGEARGGSGPTILRGHSMMRR